MKTLKKQLILAAFILASVTVTKQASAQYFYLGVNGSPVFSWFHTPPIDELLTVNSKGWGWNLGFFMRYGKKPFIQAGFDWTRSYNDFTIDIADEGTGFQDKIKFHEFDFSVLVGYNFIDLPMFKVQAHAGPFIGRSLFFSTDNIVFQKTDFKNPQIGFIAGAGIQFTNFIAGVDYTYHFTDMFTPVDIDGEKIKLDAFLQLFMVKVGFMF